MRTLDPATIWAGLRPYQQEELGVLAVTLALRGHLPIPTDAAPGSKQHRKISGRRLSAEQLQMLYAMLAEGKSAHVIALHLGCSWGTVAHRMRMAGINPPPRTDALTEAQLTQIAEMRAQGRNAVEIAQTVGCHPMTVRRHVREGRLPAVPATPAPTPEAIAPEPVSCSPLTEAATPRSRPAPANALSPERIAEIQQLRRAGLAQSEIAKRCGVSPSSVKKFAPSAVFAPVAPVTPKAVPAEPAAAPRPAIDRDEVPPPRSTKATRLTAISDAQRDAELAAIAAHIAAKGVTKGEPKYTAPSDHVTVPDAAERLKKLEIVDGYGSWSQSQKAKLARRKLTG